MRLKSFVLIENNDRYLLIQEAGEKWYGKWYLPGGSVRSDETPEAGAIREVLEEAGCRVELRSVFFVKYHQGFLNRKITIYYSGEITGGNIKTAADEDSLAVRWFTYEELDGLPLRKNLKELITIYRTHTNFTPVENFQLRED